MTLGLRAKILVFAMVCVLLPLLAAGAYLLDQNERVLGDKVHEGLANAVARRADRIDEWVRQRLQEAHSWSLSFVVYENVEAILGGTRRASEARGARVVADFGVARALPAQNQAREPQKLRARTAAQCPARLSTGDPRASTHGRLAIS